MGFWHAQVIQVADSALYYYCEKVGGGMGILSNTLMSTSISHFLYRIVHLPNLFPKLIHAPSSEQSTNFSQLSSKWYNIMYINKDYSIVTGSKISEQNALKLMCLS